MHITFILHIVIINFMSSFYTIPNLKEIHNCYFIQNCPHRSLLLKIYKRLKWNKHKEKTKNKTKMNGLESNLVYFIQSVWKYIKQIVENELNINLLLHTSYLFIFSQKNQANTTRSTLRCLLARSNGCSRIFFRGVIGSIENINNMKSKTKRT